MIRSKSFSERIVSCCSAAVILGALIAPASGAEKVLYRFQGGSDGAGPSGSLINDKAGNLYGITPEGGGGTGCHNGSGGCGTVFKIAPDHTEAVLHTFAGGCDGAEPFSGLIADKTGTMYGTTLNGGVCNSDAGFGTIFKIAPDGTESVLYAFKGAEDGETPTGGLAVDKSGNLYGVAESDPAGCTGGEGCGLVFRLSPDGNLSVLYIFKGGSDGLRPSGDLALDKAGNLYGTTSAGGGGDCDIGCGTVFKLAPDGTETVLHAFQDGSDGAIPEYGVVADSAGNLYGTTFTGGGAESGTVFKVTPEGKETVLHAFQYGAGGRIPFAGLTLDKQGNIYGTTSYGGDPGCKKGAGCGVVFELTPKGKETVLLAFATPHDGSNPAAPPLLGKHDKIYGTTESGGRHNNGVVFQVKK